MFFDKVTKLNRFIRTKYGQDDVFVIAGKCALCKHDRSAALQVIFNKVTDRFRFGTDHMKIFGTVQAFNQAVDQRGSHGKTKQ